MERDPRPEEIKSLPAEELANILLCNWPMLSDNQPTSAKRILNDAIPEKSWKNGKQGNYNRKIIDSETHQCWMEGMHWLILNNLVIIDYYDNDLSSIFLSRDGRNKMEELKKIA